MKEFTFTINSKMLASGLYRDPNPGRDVVQFEVFNNARLWRGRVAKWYPVRNPINAVTLISAGVDLSFPHPQLRRGKHRLFMFTENRIFYVDPVTYDLSELDLRDINDTSKVITPPVGDYWHLVDFGDYWYAFNGYGAVLHHNVFNIEGKEDVAVVHSGKYINAGVEFRGRSIIGGFSRDTFWGTWESFFKNWANKLYSGWQLDMPIGEDFIMWSNIGVDLGWLFYTTRGEQSLISGIGYDASSNPFIFDLFQRNDVGFMRVPFVGSVMRLEPLYSNLLVVYGSNGICILRQFSEPAPTFGIVFSFPVGLASAGAVGSNGFEHVFLGNDGALYVLQPDVKLERLGYSDHFADYLGLPHAITFDKFKGEYYISNREKTYILSADGLTTVSQIITGVVDNAGEVVSLGSHDIADRRILLRTTPLTFGRPGFKFIGHVRVVAGTPELYKVHVDYYDVSTKAWLSSTAVKVNKDGMAYIGIAAPEFKLVVTSDDFEDVEPIESIDIHVKFIDKRYVRGINVDTTTA